mmetsp:Transcript_83417/g.135226  ORF Transcript_83417/g.135226 Transcript_83417/m.135226 type:complete len:280 (-) Transcript_83417:4937-5776(-)
MNWDGGFYFRDGRFFPILDLRVSPFPLEHSIIKSLCVSIELFLNTKIPKTPRRILVPFVRNFFQFSANLPCLDASCLIFVPLERNFIPSPTSLRLAIVSTMHLYSIWRIVNLVIIFILVMLVFLFVRIALISILIFFLSFATLFILINLDRGQDIFYLLRFQLLLCQNFFEHPHNNATAPVRLIQLRFLPAQLGLLLLLIVRLKRHVESDRELLLLGLDKVVERLQFVAGQVAKSICVQNKRRRSSYIVAHLREFILVQFHLILPRLVEVSPQHLCVRL